MEGASGWGISYHFPCLPLPAGNLLVAMSVARYLGYILIKGLQKVCQLLFKNICLVDGEVTIP